ncbi:hypothetical protein ACGFI9_21365 [Micromonospora sp. NPDC048930]|uniref:hypothetical protein n=1 Tax=Micromonospora sp. NPDC048930 TaxID=3364261 RepID=UPI00372468B5
MTRAGDPRHLVHRVLTPWRVTYRAEALRRLAWSVVAVPRALAALPAALRRPDPFRALVRALLAVPVALAGSALTGMLAFLVLINVLAYPFRPWLGLGRSTGDIWADRYADSWGGPTLAGAWATHAALILLLVLPVLAWAIRGLTALQWRLTRVRPSAAVPDVPVPVVAVPARVTAAHPETRPSSSSHGRLRRAGAVLAALGLLVASSLTAHANGIGDNILWTPRDAASTLALAATLAPVVSLLLLRRTAWWQSAPTRH